MAPRELAMDGQIPTSKQATPYPEHEDVTRKYGKHMTECYAGQITGAGGIGGTLDLPFDPGYVRVVNGAGTPRIRELFVGSGVQAAGTGVAGTGLSVAADAAGKLRRVSLAVAMAANGEVVEVIAWGFRDVGGSK